MGLLLEFVGELGSELLKIETWPEATAAKIIMNSGSYPVFTNDSESVYYVT